MENIYVAQLPTGKLVVGKRFQSGLDVHGNVLIEGVSPKGLYKRLPVWGVKPECVKEYKVTPDGTVWAMGAKLGHVRALRKAGYAVRA